MIFYCSLLVCIKQIQWFDSQKLKHLTPNMKYQMISERKFKKLKCRFCKKLLLTNPYFNKKKDFNFLVFFSNNFKKKFFFYFSNYSFKFLLFNHGCWIFGKADQTPYKLGLLSKPWRSLQRPPCLNKLQKLKCSAIQIRVYY